MCTGRVDLAFVIRAFLRGMDGVLVAGCRFNECNFQTQGNYHALNMVLMAKNIMKHIGLNPDRLRLENMSAGDGILFAEIMNDFGKQVKGLGPLGKGEGIDENVLKFKLEAVARIVPYIHLVERERMRINTLSEEVYNNYFNSDDFNKLFKDTVIEKMTDSEIVSLLAKGPLTGGEIAKNLDLTPSEVSRHINSSIRQGIIRYKESEKQFALA